MSKKVTIACEVCNSKNYRTTKTHDERLQLKKYCNRCNKTTIHKEEK